MNHVSPLNSYAKTLTPNVILFGGKGFKKLIKVKWGHKGVVLIGKISVFVRKDTGDLSPILQVL